MRTWIPLSFIHILILAALANLAAAQETPASAYGKISKDIPYKDTSERNVLDVYYPASGEGPRPTHIYLHGGGWTGGGKGVGGKMKAVFDPLAEAGFIGISVEYRLVKKGSGPYMRTCVVDCMDAIRYIFTHAEELGVDTDNIFVWGGSAGGHLSLLCATAPSGTFPGDLPDPEGGIHFKAVAAWYPPTDMLLYEDISVEYNHKLRDLSQRIGRTVEDDPVAFIEISPLAHLTKKDPPVRIFHGDSDPTVNIQHSIRFDEKAEKLGVPCELITVKNANHGFGSGNGQPIEPGIDVITKGTAGFFIEHCSKPSAD
ncbi:alpha/beta hydrolase [Coraliomargarita parva]|uniref:alpha/beta hydrolase n=1 Tax=Coraliomargarita parva TaxID=3014050 RepID=UPI0022B3FDCD|nr:alpha/beta hydrolase [Coraliomargarita parva]